MPRGGRRSGKPGVAYSNRSDLNAQPVRTAPGQTYGKQAEQARAQAAMPLAQTPPIPQGGGAAPGSSPPPVPLGGLYEPSMRADEPVQHGLGAAPTGPTSRDLLLAVYRQFPNDDLLRMIETMR
jgi:hypothetical protein